MAAVVDLLAQHRIVPVVVVDSADQGLFVADALAAGGLPVAEVTFRTPAAAAAIQAIAAREDMIVGAGTVVDANQVDIAVDAGARFLVSPGFLPSVAARAASHGVPLIAGAVTASEIMAARESGLRTVKFFPAETSGGLAALRALAAPFGDVAFVPTGGVNASNLTDYLSHPQVVAVGGSWMLPAAAVADRDARTVTRLTSDAVALAATA